MDGAKGTPLVGFEGTRSRPDLLRCRRDCRWENGTGLIIPYLGQDIHSQDDGGPNVRPILLVYSAVLIPLGVASESIGERYE